MYCPNCGTGVVQGEKKNYCLNCGQELTKAKTLKSMPDPAPKNPTLNVVRFDPEPVVETFPPPKRNIPVKPALIVLVILAVPLAAFLYLYYAIPGPETLANQDSAAYFSVIVDDRAGEARSVQRLLKYFPKYEEELRKRREDLLESLEAKELSYDADIAPWLGREIGVATTLEKSGGSFGGYDSSQIFFLPIKTGKSGTAEAALEKLKDKRKDTGFKSSETDYRDHKLFVFEREAPIISSFRQNSTRGGEFEEFDAWTIHKNYLVRAGSADLLKTSLDASLDKRTLHRKNSFKKVRGKLGRNFTNVFINYAKIREFSSEGSDLGLLLAVTKSDYLEAGGYTLTGTRHGLKMTGYAYADPARLPSGYTLSDAEQFEAKIVNKVPYHTFGYYEAKNLKKVFDAYKDSPNPDVRQSYRESVAILKEDYGLDLENDLTSWMTEEYALFGLMGRAELSGGVIFNLKDKAKAEAGMKKVETAILTFAEPADGSSGAEDRSINNLLELPIVQKSLAAGSRAVTKQEIAADAPDGFTTAEYRGHQIRSYLIAYAFVDDSLVISFGDASIKSLIDKKLDATPSLAEKEAFKKIRSYLPTANNGLFYFDVREFVDDLNVLGLATGESLDGDYEAELKPLKGIATTMTTSTGEAYTYGYILIENY